MKKIFLIAALIHCSMFNVLFSMVNGQLAPLKPSLVVM